MLSIKDRLSEIFINNKLITEGQLDQALKAQAGRGGKLSDIIVELKFIKQAQLSDTLSKSLALPLFDLKCFKIDSDIVKIIPADIARLYQIIPLSKEGDSINLAMTDPLNILAIHSLREFRGLKLNPIISSFQDINQAIDLYYSAAAKVNIDNLVRELISSIEIVKRKKEVFFSEQELERISREAPAIKATNMVLEEAIKKKASEVLIEPLDNKLRIRFRIDGLLQEQDVFPMDMHAPIVSRIKVMAELDIAEHGIPQDGCFKTNILGRQVDFNIFILPTSYGEKAALRILDKAQVSLDIKELGFSDYCLGILARVSCLSHGMILVCGPAGSGKTITLYAVLKSLNSLDKNIVTIEDPVEFQLEGVNQVTVKPEIGFSFAAGMRSTLLQDPNIIMIGEIPDYETVDIAIKSALTGHLVFSTLQATTAAGAVSQLVNMGVEPYLINSSLVCVMAQRLLRKVCPYCKEAYTLNKEAAANLKLDVHKINKLQFYKAKGCRYCFNTGYSGRTVIAEVLQFSHKIHELILNRAEEYSIKQQARLEGMQTLREAGWGVVLKGQTTIEEVLRVSAPD
ncbi:MAG: Flp pilus assembly complex ATPase component TadA [Candidatus Omnitrophica bacterium]|nr:Flp pilus assembly complex ATPase component TadA [Candidatus Omnitrophota bacterium]MBU1923817.1 Flp pilus assembly complex ATPase component TadA [Candidatus Omnitrophota bacterium]